MKELKTFNEELKINDELISYFEEKFKKNSNVKDMIKIKIYFS